MLIRWRANIPPLDRGCGSPAFVMRDSRPVHVPERPPWPRRGTVWRDHDQPLRRRPPGPRPRPRTGPCRRRAGRLQARERSARYRDFVRAAAAGCRVFVRRALLRLGAWTPSVRAPVRCRGRQSPARRALRGDVPGKAVLRQAPHRFVGPAVAPDANARTPPLAAVSARSACRRHDRADAGETRLQVQARSAPVASASGATSAALGDDLRLGRSRDPDPSPGGARTASWSTAGCAVLLAPPLRGAAGPPPPPAAPPPW